MYFKSLQQFFLKTFFLFQETAKVSIMVLFKNDLQSLDYQELVKSSLMNKDPNCALYSKEGKRFSVHKEILYQTPFMRNIIIGANLSCCGVLEIFCPCSEKTSHNSGHFMQSVMGPSVYDFHE